MSTGSIFRDGLHGAYSTAPRNWVDTFACNCIGPRNGEPRCPCAMRNVTERDGRWIVPEQDLGPVVRQKPTTPNARDE
ncbi:hypothetical protein IED13_00990 [Bosea sp. SSUT16]|uniref:Uncharacterized protein n=1 Tax=Bosea spartocytisi TaxID=2773451 RepID=A0A927E4L0_9HYPH|nr:hypothetical protein [Bosea spartocytisi]MBD3844254.1 hypothetical protein [Bosea spartocytisi]MCT4470638.1 hypothetical protein [Bosea spartocytisi]